MITKESELRVALQAALVTALAIYGFWGWALLMLMVLLPWKPILAVGAYLTEPLVAWRFNKSREIDRRKAEPIEGNLGSVLFTTKYRSRPVVPEAAIHFESEAQDVRSNADGIGDFSFSERHPAGHGPTSNLVISPAIQEHVRDLPGGMLSNMQLEVEKVHFYGDKAEASVRFKSRNVTDLVIRQRYVLRRCGDQWQVETRQLPPGSNPIGSNKAQPASRKLVHRSLRLTS